MKETLSSYPRSDKKRRMLSREVNAGAAFPSKQESTRTMKAREETHETII